MDGVASHFYSLSENRNKIANIKMMVKSLTDRIGFCFPRYFSVVLRLIPLQPQNSPFGFKQLRLLALHFAKNKNEKSLMPLKPTLSGYCFKKGFGNRHMVYAKIKAIGGGIMI